MSSPPAVAEVEKAPVVAAASPAKAVEAAKPAQSAKPSSPPPPAVTPKAGSVWQRFVAFAVGAAVSSAYFYTTLREDVAASSAAIEATLAAAKVDSAAVNEELRKRLALLEHEVAALKNK